MHLVFDVESVGLHGEGYAVAGGLKNMTTGEWSDTFKFACSPDTCEGTIADRKWIADNIPHIEPTHSGPVGVRSAFWEQWKKVKEEYPDVTLAAECGWPVEANFLSACVLDDPEARSFEGPYPLHEIASFMQAAGMNPMEIYERWPEELPKHCPLGDARQSARLLFMAADKIENG